MKWMLRLTSLIVISIAWLAWKEAAHLYGFESALMGVYRGITLGSGFWIAWVLACKVDGSYRELLQAHPGAANSFDMAVLAMIACLAIAAGVAAARYIYFFALDQSVDEFIAASLAVIGFLVVGGTTFYELGKTVDRFESSKSP